MSAEEAMRDTHMSYNEYVLWCLSRRPASAQPAEEGPESSADTIPAGPDSDGHDRCDSCDPCPVTVRSAPEDRVILTPSGSS